LASNNLFIIDAVDTTDPTTGTFGTNLNFEAIQEVTVYTSAAGVEYSRAQGAIVNVVTKSGTNRFEASAKYLFLNDKWDRQNTTKSEVTSASLARVKFDQALTSWPRARRRSGRPSARSPRTFSRSARTSSPISAAPCSWPRAIPPG